MILEDLSILEDHVYPWSRPWRPCPGESRNSLDRSARGGATAPPFARLPLARCRSSALPGLLPQGEILSSSGELERIPLARGRLRRVSAPLPYLCSLRNGPVPGPVRLPSAIRHVPRLDPMPFPRSWGMALDRALGRTDDLARGYPQERSDGGQVARALLSGE